MAKQDIKLSVIVAQTRCICQRRVFMKNQFVLPSGLKNLCEDFVNELKSLFEKEGAKELRQCWLKTLPTIHKAIRVQCFLIWRRDRRITQRRIDEARRKEFVLPDASKMNDIELAVETDWRYWFYAVDKNHVGLFRDAEFFKQVNLNSHSLIEIYTYPTRIDDALLYQQRQAELYNHYCQELNNRVKKYSAEAKHVIGALADRSESIKEINNLRQYDYEDRASSNTEEDSEDRFVKLLEEDSFAKAFCQIKATTRRRRGHGSDARKSEETRNEREREYTFQYGKTIGGRPISEDDPEAEVIKRERQSKIEEYLESLPHNKRYAWKQRPNMTQEEIAEVLKCNQSTISRYQSDVEDDIHKIIQN